MVQTLLLTSAGIEREIFEETGLKVKALEVVQAYTKRWFYRLY